MDDIKWQHFISSRVLSDNVLVSVLALAMGVLAGAFHTPLSLLVGLLITLLLRMFLVNHGPVTILLSVAYYFAGFLCGIALFACNRTQSPWKSQRFPWKSTRLYSLYMTP